MVAAWMPLTLLAIAIGTSPGSKEISSIKGHQRILPHVRILDRVQEQY